MSVIHAVSANRAVLNTTLPPPTQPSMASTWEALEHTAFETTYSKGSFLFREGDRPQGIFLVVAGAVKLSMGSTDGRTLVVRTVGAHEIVGLSAAVLGCPYQVTAETLQLCHVKLIWREDLLACLRTSPVACLRVMKELADEHNATEEQMRTHLLLHTATQRLAHLLLDLGKCKNDGTAHLSLTHDEIAEIIGVSRETVTRLLALLKGKHLIELKGSALIIPNENALLMVERGQKPGRVRE